MVCQSALNSLFPALLDPLDIFPLPKNFKLHQWRVLKRRCRRKGFFFLVPVCFCSCSLHNCHQHVSVALNAIHSLASVWCPFWSGRSLPASFCLLTPGGGFLVCQSWTVVPCLPALVSWHCNSQFPACHSVSTVLCASALGFWPSSVRLPPCQFSSVVPNIPVLACWFCTTSGPIKTLNFTIHWPVVISSLVRFESQPWREGPTSFHFFPSWIFPLLLSIFF